MSTRAKDMLSSRGEDGDDDRMSPNGSPRGRGGSPTVSSMNSNTASGILSGIVDDHMPPMVDEDEVRMVYCCTQGMVSGLWCMMDDGWCAMYSVVDGGWLFQYQYILMDFVRECYVGGASFRSTASTTAKAQHPDRRTSQATASKHSSPHNVLVRVRVRVRG